MEIVPEAPGGKLISKSRWGRMKRGRGGFFFSFFWGEQKDEATDFLFHFSWRKKYAGRYVLVII